MPPFQRIVREYGILGHKSPTGYFVRTITEARAPMYFFDTSSFAELLNFVIFR